ncbi:MAG: hypothetical protein PF551_00535 [Candidatus Marinimicrobia bacterium]|nr:hypothetical protein [Candidatus Neomarinimicrobiota bacterium]
MIFIVLIFLGMIFIRFNVSIDGEYKNKQFDGQITLYWIKYLFAIILSIEDRSKLNVKIKFLQIPIKFTIPLIKKIKKHKIQSVKSKKSTNIENEKTDSKQNIYKSIRKIKSLYIEKRPQITFYRNLLKEHLLIIWRKYLRFKLKNLTANIGLSDPSNTGKLSGYLYTLPFINNKKNINLQWDYINTRYDIIIKMNIITKLYGILFRLLLIWREINKFKKRGEIND